MNAAYPRLVLCLGLLSLTLGAGQSSAADGRKPSDAAPVVPATLPKAADLEQMLPHPSQMVLHGSDAAVQMILTGMVAKKPIDLTSDSRYTTADARIATVTPSGRVVPRANGRTELVANYGGREVEVPIQVVGMEDADPINFTHRVVPIFSKLGCNSGGCHGKLAGQNGFRLSLLGAESELDYLTLVKEDRGRRLNPSAPDNSLLLLKAAGVMAHGGGKKMDRESDEYRVIRRWIASGMPFGSPQDPTILRISVYPESTTLARQARQQLAVYAHYSDGTVEDVTRRVQYESNEQEIAMVDPTGLIRTLNLSGQAAIMARFLGQVVVHRVSVPLGVSIPPYDWQPKTVVDAFTQKKWQQLGIVPSELCTDEQFIRRVYLDITGTLPTPDQIRAFLSDPNPNRRDLLIDRLVDSDEHSYFFANKWADILRVKRGNQVTRAYGTFVFHEWIYQSLKSDKPYDQFVRQIVCAVGDETTCPPVVWYKDLQTPDLFVDNLAQVFLGTRMQCAQCHHHPYEKYSQDDYWGLAAFSGRLGRKTIPVPGTNAQNANQQRVLIYNKSSGTVTNKKTNKPAPIKTLDGPEVEVGLDEDPRQVLVDWMVDPKNPYFARALVNRYFAHFFGRGIVDPLDDMRVSNPPSNPELLDALASDFVNNHYSLKHLVRTLCKSRTYQLSSTPNPFNGQDKQTYARYYPRRMTAEVLFDAVAQASASPTAFANLPQDRYAPRRAIMLPDESFASYFLDVFGRPQRISACECERVTEANMAQVLHLLNSEEVQGKIGRTGGRAELLARDPRPDADKVEELFLWTLGEKPTEQKLQVAIDHIHKAKDKKTAYEDLLWALVNGKGFSFNK